MVIDIKRQELLNKLDLDLDIKRKFQYDYLYFDLIFLTIYVCILLYYKYFEELLIGIIFGIIIYIIDSQIWSNISINNKQKIREYDIENDNTKLSKFKLDFMMTISYGIIAFSWEWILFKAYENNNINTMINFSILIFAIWLFIPLLSQIVKWNEKQIHTVRHMQGQFSLSIIVTFVGYLILFIIKIDINFIGILFLIGIYQAFVMEFALYIFKVRDININTFIYECLFLINQGIPYMYLIFIMTK